MWKNLIQMINFLIFRISSNGKFKIKLDVFLEMDIHTLLICSLFITKLLRDSVANYADWWNRFILAHLIYIETLVKASVLFIRAMEIVYMRF